MKNNYVSFLLLLILPSFSHAQDISNTFAPAYQVKCGYNIPLKDKEKCRKTVKAFNNMTPAEKQEHNQRVINNREQQYKQELLYELRENNRLLRNQRYR